jgi:2-(1,2-epoxy-1,2-dihydrophenyl)acetyl-CoA isomerase
MTMPVLVERRGAVAILTLNRPDVGNTIDVPLARALMEAAIDCDEDDAVRCVLLTGNGRFFCAGGDLGAFASAGDRSSVLIKEITAYLHVAIARLANMGKPLVTAVNGPAAGAGLSLAILGDLALAAPTAHFTVAYTAVGLTPDGGSTWLLPRLVGLRRAQELVLTNRRVPAPEAAAIGLITRVTGDGTLMDEALATAAGLAAGATQALGQARRLLLASFETGLETQMDREARAIAAATRTAHGREGIRAFLAKQKPDFSR